MITKSKGLEKELWTIEAAGQKAMILPEVGGELIELCIDGIEVFHKVESLEAVKAECTSYGLPILFPPNRIDGGHFTFAGKEYQFEVNEPATGNSLHGFLHKEPWEIEALQDSDDEVVVRLFYHAEPGWAHYDVYPVTFLAEVIYTLNKEGLFQEVRITNTGKEVMPYGLGWHTAFRITPSTVMNIAVGNRVEMSERILPTGNLLPLSEDEQKLRAEGLNPVYAEMDDHFTAKPFASGINGAVLTHKEEGTRVIYTVDPFYKHWMVWNCNQEGSFVCIEPQNWRVNAPNLPIPAEESGMGSIEAGETLVVKACVKAERI